MILRIQNNRQPLTVLREESSGARHVILPTLVQAGDLVDVTVSFDVVAITGVLSFPLTSVFFSFDEVVVVKTFRDVQQVQSVSPVFVVGTL